VFVRLEQKGRVVTSQERTITSTGPFCERATPGVCRGLWGRAGGGKRRGGGWAFENRIGSGQTVSSEKRSIAAGVPVTIKQNAKGKKKVTRAFQGGPKKKNAAQHGRERVVGGTEGDTN